MSEDRRPPDDPDATKTSADFPTTPSAQLPHTIGQYRIVSKLGEGGMGVVYEAEQQSPRRKVAIKVVRGGQFVDEHRVRVFQREADTLARLKHPNIAAIYESGHTDDGQHFFAMELVQGETLDGYMNKRPEIVTREELRFRLALFRKIAHAVHYAHQRGVIHRDLKPSNVIVTDEARHEVSASTIFGARLPEIKILDFGLARITEGDIAAATMTTEVGVIKGTLPYMSPEQARGDPEEIDLRTDVYALGVMLYEMLTGGRPYDVLRKSLAEALRVICEEPPLSLRGRITGVRRVDSDVETIVGKALEKEADRRYASAATLAEDIERWLTSQPILARPPSTTYQLRKFAKRHAVGVSFVVAGMVFLVVFAVTMTVQAARIAAERDRANQELRRSERVVYYLGNIMGGVRPARIDKTLRDDLRLVLADSRRARGASEREIESTLESFDELFRGVSITDAALRMIDREVLEPAGKTIENELRDDLPTAARLTRRISQAYWKIGLWDKAEPYAETAVELHREAYGDEHRRTLEAANDLAATWWRQGRLDEAERLLSDTIEKGQRTLGSDDREFNESLMWLGEVYRRQGRYEEAESLQLRTLEFKRRVDGDDTPSMLAWLNNLANTYFAMKRYAEAESLYLEVLDGYRRIHAAAPDSAADAPGSGTIDALGNLGSVYYALGRDGEAEQKFLEAIELGRRYKGSGYHTTLGNLSGLSRVYERQGRYEDAEPLRREILATRRRVRGPGHPDTVFAMISLAALLTNAGNHDEARELFASVLEEQRRAAQTDGASAEAKNRYAWLMLTIEFKDLRDPAIALSFAREANELTDFENAAYLDTLALAYRRTGDVEKAIETQRKAISLLPEDANRTDYEERLAEFEAALQGSSD